MSKYDKLTAFLGGIETSTRRMRFDEIEDVLGFRLPNSARSHAPWWGNDPRPGRQCNAWLNAGFVTEQVDLCAEAVTFCRAERQAAGRSGRRRIAEPESDILPDAPDAKVVMVIAMESRDDKQLQLSDLRDSGSIE